MLIALASVLGLAGPGAYALDPVLGLALPQPLTFWVGLAVVLMGVAGANYGSPMHQAWRAGRSEQRPYRGPAP